MSAEGFSDFAEPFCSGWNAHREHGDLDPEQFVEVLMEAFKNSGPQQAQRVFAAIQESQERSRTDA